MSSLSHSCTRAIAWAVVLVALLAGAGAVDTLGDVRHRAKVKTATDLLPPDGSSRPDAEGRAETLYTGKDHGPIANRKIVQTLTVTASGLAADASYRLVLDGVDLGAFTAEADGSLVVKFRAPSKRKFVAFPGEVPLLPNSRAVELRDAVTGEVVLSGSLVPIEY